MSEAPKSNTPKKSKPDTPTASTAKAADSGPSESKTSTAEGGSTTSSGEGSAAASTDSATPSRAAAGGAGGAAAVHYGFFSNVKTEEYRSGWDAIWGDKDEKKESKPSSKTRSRPKAKAREPVEIDLDFADLPRDLQDGLAEAARAQLKKSRVNYDNRAKAGAVSWRIACEVKR